MKIDELIVRTPWDSAVFGVETYEIRSQSAEVLERIAGIPGHFTVKVSPLISKKFLCDHDFYYCDTLIEPFCSVERFISHQDPKVRISKEVELDELLHFSHGAYSHGRFHRDFNLDACLADVRYDNWLKQLHQAGDCFGLLYDGDVAGYICVNDNKLVLHALSEKYRGLGLAKYFWSTACEMFFASGHKELTSSVSASNVAVLNLYASLGFRFRNPMDVYHRYKA